MISLPIPPHEDQVLFSLKLDIIIKLFDTMKKLQYVLKTSSQTKEWHQCFSILIFILLCIKGFELFRPFLAQQTHVYLRVRKIQFCKPESGGMPDGFIFNVS